MFNGNDTEAIILTEKRISYIEEQLKDKKIPFNINRISRGECYHQFLIWYWNRIIKVSISTEEETENMYMMECQDYKYSTSSLEDITKKIIIYIV